MTEQIGTAYDSVDSRHSLLVRMDPEFHAAYRRLVDLALVAGSAEHDEKRARALDPLTGREFVLIGALLQKGGMTPDRVTRHMRRAVKLGATIEQLLGVVEVLVIPRGAGYLLGLAALQLLLDEMEAASASDTAQPGV